MVLKKTTHYVPTKQEAQGPNSSLKKVDIKLKYFKTRKNFHMLQLKTYKPLKKLSYMSYIFSMLNFEPLLRSQY